MVVVVGGWGWEWVGVDDGGRGCQSLLSVKFVGRLTGTPRWDSLTQKLWAPKLGA